MKVTSFRITGFRSIKDTGWQTMSPDNITVLVGQNESGKSSILEALSYLGNPSKVLRDADMRSDGTETRVAVRLEVSPKEVDLFLDELDESFCRLAREAFQRSRNSLIVELSPKASAQPATLEAQLVEPVILPGMPEELLTQLSDVDKASRKALEDQNSKLAEWICDAIPHFFLFKEEAATLPDSIVLEGGTLLAGQAGRTGARNFIAASRLNINDILQADDRKRGTLIRQANERVNTELKHYWSQLLGRESRITIECEFGRHPPTHSDKPGAPYLTFWVSEGLERFYPSQRSRGTRWFVSVFLHLLAIEVRPFDAVVMLDEPGSFLHVTAQEDVRRLIERVAKTFAVIYSTHSPGLVDFEKPYRILAIERAQDDELADTTLLTALQLASASTETLTPILQKMGADIRHQAVIQADKNVLLEEPSAHFYLRTFEKLLGMQTGLAFISASGVNNVPMLFSLLLAWRLKFCVLLDDDSQAREVRKNLSKNFFGNDEAATNGKLLRLRGCDGIEDVFAHSEFTDVVLERRFAADPTQKNSAFAKKNKVNKAVTAYRLFVRVEQGEVTAEHFSAATKDRIKALLDELSEKSQTAMQ